MLYMVIETFKIAGGIEVYRRSRDRGRLLPKGVRYVSSWVDLEFARCFQLMETEDEKLLGSWISQWEDLVDFEVIAVRTSSDAMQAIAPRL